MNHNYSIFKIFCVLFLLCSPVLSDTSQHNKTASFTLAPKSFFSSLHLLIIDSCRYFVENAKADKKKGLFSKNKIKFSLNPTQEAWKNLQKVQDALGTPQQYCQPLTSEDYDRIMAPDTLLALAKSFVNFFPAYNKFGKIKRISEKELQTVVDSVQWTAEQRQKASLNIYTLEEIMKIMDSSSKPDAMGITLNGNSVRHIYLHKENMIKRQNTNHIFPLKVFLHELVHALPAYKDTMFNDTLAIAFLAFAGIKANDIYHLDPWEDYVTALHPKQCQPFNYSNLNDDVKKILEPTKDVLLTGYKDDPRQYKNTHPFVSAPAGYLEEPYDMNRNLGVYIAKRFKSVLKQLRDSTVVDSQTAYLLAKEDMLEALRQIYSYLLNTLGAEHFLKTYGERKVKVREWSPSKEKILYTAA